MKENLTHFDKEGNAVMVDVTQKASTHRTARAQCTVNMSREAFQAVVDGKMGKGDVLGVARVAGIMAAKRTWELIPMCHPLMLTKCHIDFACEGNQIHVMSLVKTTGQTGVEMEALQAASTAALTIYDMCKAVDKNICITDMHLAEKTGGKSGNFVHKR